MANKYTRWPASESEMGKIIYGKDWSETSLGRMEEWPQSLHSALNMCLTSNSPISIYWGDELIFLYNDAWKELLGDKHPSSLGQSARKVFEDSWQTLNSSFEQVFSEEEVTEVNSQLISFPGGKEHLLDFSFSPIPNDDGSVGGIYNIATAVDTQAETKFPGSESRSLPDYYRSSALGLHWIGPDGVIIKANQAVLDMLGYSRDEYVGHHISDFHLDQSAVDKILTSTSSGVGFHDYETPMKCKDGSIRHVLINSDIHTEEEEVKHTRCFIRDITDQKQVGAELMRKIGYSHSQMSGYDSVISKDLIYIFDLNYRFIFVNNPLLEMLGLTLEEAIGKSLFEVGYEPWHAEMHEREIDRVIATKQSVQGELSFQHDKIGQRIYHYSFTPIFDDKDDVEAVAGRIRDITEHKQTERALRKSEEKYRTLFETMDKGLCIIKVEFDENEKPVDWYYLEANHAYEKQTGLKNIAGERASEILPNINGDLINTYGKAVQTGEPAYFEGYIDEFEGWFDISAYPVEDSKKSKIAVLTSNITQRKQKELTNALLGAVVEGSDDAIISKDLNSIITSWNNGAERIFGYTAEEAIGQPITMIFPEDRIDEEDDIINRIRRGERVDHFETVRKRKDGTLLDVSLTISPIKDSEGNIVGASKIARDITERKQNELNNALLSAIVEGSDDAIISKNLDSIITSWNDSAERMFGYTAEEAIGQPITMIFPEERLDEEIDIINRIRRGERIEHFETVRKRKDGTLLDVSLTISPIKDSEGNIVGASKIARDITKRKEIEKELEAMNETLEERVEERTKQLRSYQRQLRSLASQLNQAEEQERQRLAAELHDRLGQLLAVAKMKAEGLEHTNLSNQSPSDVEELKQVVDDALKFNQNLMTELKPPPALDKEDITEVLYWTAKQIEKQGLNIDIKDDGQSKPVDKEMRTTLHQSVRELFLNVLKHADTNEARLLISSERGNVKIIVEDSGKGFKLNKEKLAPTDQGGFGLFNIQERMDWHGGTFEIETEPGDGTKATLYAPLKEQEKQSAEEEILPPSEEEKQEELQQKIKILLVDDHEMMRRGLRQMIEKQDDLVIVGEGSDGKEAIELARETSPHVVIMDVNMPFVDGIEATKKIKAERPDTRVIGLSLHDSSEVVQDMRDAGATDYLTKNEAFESLIATIRAEASALRR